MLGASILRSCSAATFAFNNERRRGEVLTGTVAQAMAIWCRSAAAVLPRRARHRAISPTCSDFRPKVADAPPAGRLHFVWGRYYSYRLPARCGANLVAPIQQVKSGNQLARLAIWLGEDAIHASSGLPACADRPEPERTRAHRHRSRRPCCVRAEDHGEIDAEKPTSLQSEIRRGLLFAHWLSAIGYRLSPILVRVGLEGKGLGASFAGGSSPT